MATPSPSQQLTSAVFRGNLSSEHNYRIKSNLVHTIGETSAYFLLNVDEFIFDSWYAGDLRPSEFIALHCKQHGHLVRSRHCNHLGVPLDAIRNGYYWYCGGPYEAGPVGATNQNPCVHQLLTAMHVAPSLLPPNMSPEDFKRHMRDILEPEWLRHAETTLATHIKPPNLVTPLTPFFIDRIIAYRNEHERLPPDINDFQDPPTYEPPAVLTL